MTSQDKYIPKNEGWTLQSPYGNKYNLKFYQSTCVGASRLDGMWVFNKNGINRASQVPLKTGILTMGLGTFLLIANMWIKAEEQGYRRGMASECRYITDDAFNRDDARAYLKRIERIRRNQRNLQEAEIIRALNNDNSPLSQSIITKC